MDFDKIKPYSTIKIEGEEFFVTKRVSYKGQNYIEIKSTNYLRPKTIYIDKSGKAVKDWATHFALSLIYCTCVLSLHGKPVMDFTLNLDENEFTIERGKLNILNKEKKAIFEKYVQ